MLTHPTINLNKKAWLIRRNLLPQTLTWAGVDPLIAYINLSRLVVSVVTPSVIIKIKYLVTECTLCYYAACCQLFLQADASCGVINARIYPPICQIVCLTLWRRNYFFFNFRSSCIQNVNNTGTKEVSIMKQTAFWREKSGEYRACLKYSVPIFVE